MDWVMVVVSHPLVVVMSRVMLVLPQTLVDFCRAMMAAMVARQLGAKRNGLGVAKVGSRMIGAVGILRHQKVESPLGSQVYLLLWLLVLLQL